jgi:hypothetical protein
MGMKLGMKRALGWIALIALVPGAPQRALASDLRIHGLLDVVAAEHSDAHDLNRLTRGDSSFDPYGLRLFVDSQVTNRLAVYSQFVLRDATTPYVDGAYLLWSPLPSHDAHLLAGKIPWPIGTYAPRTYSNKNPLIGTPLMYQYHTTLVWYEIAPSADALLAAAGSGQWGVSYFGYSEGYGMPIIDDSYWDVGVTLTGSERPFEYALGMTAGTPGWASTGKDENSGKTVLGRAGLAPLPGLRFGVSGAYGPYLIEDLNPELPPGKDANDYHQNLRMADVEVLVGHLEARAEGARNRWQTPTVGDLDVKAGYLEVQYALPFGGFVAGRADRMRFGDIADSTGALHSWDSNVDRFEIGGGYRFDRNMLMKLVYQSTRLHESSGTYRRLSLFAAQASISF